MKVPTFETTAREAFGELIKGAPQYQQGMPPSEIPAWLAALSEFYANAVFEAVLAGMVTDKLRASFQPLPDATDGKPVVISKFPTADDQGQRAARDGPVEIFEDKFPR